MRNDQSTGARKIQLYYQWYSSLCLYVIDSKFCITLVERCMNNIFSCDPVLLANMSILRNDVEKGVSEELKKFPSAIL